VRLELLKKLCPEERALSKSNPSRDDYLSNTGLSSKWDSSVSALTVSGCGVSDVNGRYTRSLTKLHDGAPSFSKEGKWSQRNVAFIMYRKRTTDGSRYWMIGIADKSTLTQILYKAAITTSNESSLPPTSGWVARGRGINPAPKINFSVRV